jgi:probable addiction module antidote protein
MRAGSFGPASSFGEPEMSKSYAPAVPAQLARELNIAFASSDAQTICQAIGDAVRKLNIAELSRETGLQRSSIYRAFISGEQLPNFATVLSVLTAMGMQLKVVPSVNQRAGR